MNTLRPVIGSLSRGPCHPAAQRPSILPKVSLMSLGRSFAALQDDRELSMQAPMTVSDRVGPPEADCLCQERQLDPNPAWWTCSGVDTSSRRYGYWLAVAFSPGSAVPFRSSSASDSSRRVTAIAAVVASPVAFVICRTNWWRTSPAQ